MNSKSGIAGQFWHSSEGSCWCVIIWDHQPSCWEELSTFCFWEWFQYVTWHDRPSRGAQGGREFSWTLCKVNCIKKLGQPLTTHYSFVARQVLLHPASCCGDKQHAVLAESQEVFSEVANASQHCDCPLSKQLRRFSFKMCTPLAWCFSLFWAHISSMTSIYRT